MNAIVALCRLKNGKLGIGINNQLPWKCKEDMDFFKEKTKNKYIIMGRKTFESMGSKPLKDRKTHFIISRNEYQNYGNVYYVNNKSKIIDYLRLSNISLDQVFVIGGSEIYSLFEKEIDYYHVNIMKNIKYEFDSYFEFPKKNLDIKYYKQYNAFDHVLYTTSSKQNNDMNYLSLLDDIYKNGKQKTDRTGTGTKSCFAKQISFDISDYRLPLLTTKFVSFRLVFEELLWFLRGDTNVKNLREKKCFIWDYNTSREFLDLSGKHHYQEDVLVQGYGQQIRNFNGFDQLKYIEDLIQNDPDSRRIMWNLWNSEKLSEMVLPPCHNQVQFYIQDSKLSCHMYQRSVDTFLGFPWNIASYSLFTFILCKRHNLSPGTITISTGDTHIYNNHFTQVEEQLKRSYRPSPVLYISDSVKDLDWNDINIDLFKLYGYLPHETIKAEMS